MFRRLIREEQGVALGLAIVVVVLIGVMGAGLLVFVSSDLEAVVEVNQGQVAFETADAGVKAARRHLLGGSDPAEYDGVSSPTVTPPNLESSWSYSGAGKSFNFNGSTFNVKIQYLPPVTAPATPTADQAPEVIPSGQTALPNGRNYYRVISEGRTGNSSRRKVEAIFNTYDLDIPKAYFTPGGITVNGSACITSVSLFAQGSITLNGNGNCTTGGHISGNDEAYGNWQNGVNPTARPTTLAGFGATGTVSAKVPGRDYDSSTCPKFVAVLSAPSSCASPSRITFPFNVNNTIDLLDLESTAREQDLETSGTTHYFEIGDSATNVSTWPANSTKDTVVYYKFTDGTPANNQLKWFVSGNCSDNPPKQGTLVVEGAGFTTQPNKARFQGVVIVREGEFVPGIADDGTSSDSGNTCLEGFVNASGNITISGSVTPSSSADLANRPGFYGVRQWSWRELYQ